VADHAPDQVLEWLRNGNARFQKRVWANDPRRQELIRGQRPRAAVLGCADSRVAPEIAFDAELGDLFVVRVAGGVANTASIASLEYAVSQLGVKLIVVFAHEGCGAVAAAIEGGDASRNLNRLMEYIAPAVEACDGADVDTVARVNARLNAERLTVESGILRRALEEGDLRIETAFFHFAIGAVEFD
jgi:carbonic anhydrase